MLCSLLIFRKKSTIFLSFFVEISSLIYLITDYSKILYKTSNNSKEIFNQTISISANVDKDDKAIETAYMDFYVSKAEIKQNYLIKEFLFVVLTHFLAILFKYMSSNLSRIYFMNYYKFYKYYENGRDYILNNEHYQISLINSAKSIKKIFNENLKNTIKELKQKNLVQVSESSEDQHKKNFKNSIKFQKKFFNNEIPIINIIPNDNLTNINININDNDNSHNVIFLNDSASKSDHIENTKKINEESKELLEEVKSLNEFLTKMEATEIVPIFREYFREKNITNLFSFLFLKI